MNDAEFNLLLENATRRKLTAGEEARLHAHLASDPSAKAVWEEEMALSQLLHRLPDAPLATNFTAQVLEAVEREERQHRRTPRILRRLGLRRPVQQFAAACLLLVVLASSYWQYRTVQRERMALALANVARSVETVSQVASLPPAEMWNDYEFISRLRQTRPEADEKLLNMLKEVAMK